MTNLVPIDQAARQLPAALKARMQQGLGVGSNFIDNVAEGFPRLSIKGKVFRARISGQETPLIDPTTRQPIPYLDCIMVNASRQLAKNFYARGFEEGDLNPPDCWSLDSVRPDPSVPNKINPTCADCPMNVFGSRTTPSGKQAKACSDSRRVAIVLPHELGHESPRVFMMKVPQSSLKNLKAHAELLRRYGMDINVAVTRMAFDYNEAFPKLLFNFVRAIDEVSYAKVIDLAESSYVQGMLVAPDFDNAPSVHPVQTNSVAGMVQQPAPVLMDEPEEQVIVAPVIADPVVTQPVQQAVSQPEPLTEVKETSPKTDLIRLPDGKLYNPATGQYVEAPKEAAKLDPATIKLPDGRFFNPGRGAYVTGPELGAGEVTAAAPQPTSAEPPKRTRRTRAEMEAFRAAEAAKLAAQPTPVQAQPVQAQPAPVNPPTNGHAAPIQAAPDGGSATIEAADADLDNVLADLLPEIK